ncbi:MAG: amino acid racemase [Treponema sp.]|nr:amino acid racemase [Treponema sp.]
MKKIGLIGGTGPESTLVYYKELNGRLNKAVGGKAFPEIGIESLDLFKALDLVSKEKYDELAAYIGERIANLEKGGAQIIALTAATMHVVFDKLKPGVHVPFISIPEAAAEKAVSKGYKKVGLLGTIFTMEKDYLSKAFAARGIEVFIPSKEDRLVVHDRIANELEYGIVKEESQAELISVIQKMKMEQGIEAVILGCTELPLALNENNCPVDCLDIMEIHIQKLVEFGKL